MKTKIFQANSEKIMNIHMKLTLFVVETVVRAATGQEQHKQIPEKLFSECAYLIFNTEIKHRRVISDRPSALLQLSN